ncbi:hypothetical protein [Agromyces cerinus]|uniref:D-alanyl-D-alanine dipeptidase n=1 Tax=Agromyces cerinus subsp. cerinus TaxID=232089 RepID=A0A1N6EN21_9MICO|nr:hypothetical protein [Agromyces cerinus]SIN84377.1 hypothetical protein SAMN05443544_1303 [Agromyces cerinus subsp. cerinus]
MNVQRIAAIAAITGAVLGGASIVALGAAAYTAGQPQATAEIVSSEIDDSARQQPDQTSAAAPAAAGHSSQLAAASGTDTNAADYNPYLDPLNADYVTPEARSEWLGKQAVIRKCMTDAGFEYLDWQWWLGNDAQPKGLDYESSILWTQALYGPDIYNPGGGCADVGSAAEAAARAAGEPLSAPVPEDDPTLPTERQEWLDFQDLVRACMTEAGQEYLYWEWWNPEYGAQAGIADPEAPLALPAQPAGLSESEKAEWSLALDGDAGLGAAYRWEDAGCWGRAVHESGNDNMH